MIKNSDILSIVYYVYFLASTFANEIIGTKINLIIITKSYAADQKKVFPQNEFYSRSYSRVHSDSVIVNPNISIVLWSR